METAGPTSKSPLRERLFLAWRVLRGYPVAYRLHIIGGEVRMDPELTAVRCFVQPKPGASSWTR